MSRRNSWEARVRPFHPPLVLTGPDDEAAGLLNRYLNTVRDPLLLWLDHPAQNHGDT